MNIAASAGRRSARLRRLVLIGWLAFPVLAFMAGNNVGTDVLTDEEAAVGESGTAARITAEAYPATIDESVIVQSKTLDTDAPKFRAAVADVQRRLQRTARLSNVHEPHDNASPSPVSDDGRSALVTFEVKGNTEDATAKQVVDASPAHTKDAQAAHPGFNIQQFRSGSAEAFMRVFEKDHEKATVGSPPVTLTCCW
jgi:hypothetical protein